MLKSAGILAYRVVSGELEFFLMHPGGPFFANKDEGFWTIPKGGVEDDEDLLATAKREFLEETGVTVSGEFLNLGHIVQKGGKHVHCFGVEFDFEATVVKSNTFEMQWPPHSGKMATFPEMDRAEWFVYEIARRKINAQQAELLDRLRKRI